MQKVIALTGPSCAGKTTLADLIVKKDNFVVPTHSTTRKRRLDDVDGLYRYLSHEEFRCNALNNNFLFWSGDSCIIEPKYGNFYGLLNSDYIDSKPQVIYISYKDIDQIRKLNLLGYNIQMVNLRYNNIDNMAQRLIDSGKDYTDEDIERRIICANKYEELYGNIIYSSNDILIIPTDIFGIEETYEEVSKKLIRK